MMHLTYSVNITETEFTITQFNSISKQRFCGKYNTSLFLGDALALDELKDKYIIFGETYSYLDIEQANYMLESLIEKNQDSFKPKLLSIDKLRMLNHMNSSYIWDGENQILYLENLHNIFEIIISILFYYACRNEMGENFQIKRCKHCGKWFTVTNLQTEFCERESPCSFLKVDGKYVLNAKNNSCRRATKTIKLKFQRDIHNIEEKGNLKQIELLHQFKNEKHLRYRKNTEYILFSWNFYNPPSVENIIEIQKFLFSDEMSPQTHKKTRGKKK